MDLYYVLFFFLIGTNWCGERNFLCDAITDDSDVVGGGAKGAEHTCHQDCPVDEDGPAQDAHELRHAVRTTGVVATSAEGPLPHRQSQIGR
jgi:hypothetical protein